LSQAEQLQSTISFFKLDGGPAVAKTSIAPAGKQVKPVRKNYAAHFTHAMPKKTNGGTQPAAAVNADHPARGIALDLSKDVKSDMTDAEFERY
jgi:hypothetical protein